MLCAQTHANNLIDKKYNIYKIEFDRKNERIKVLSKNIQTKECDREIKKQETIKLIKLSIQNMENKNRKITMDFRCYK